MQRPLSIFPAGVAGLALLLLRVLVVSMLLIDGTAGWNLGEFSWVFPPFMVVASCLGASVS